MTPDRVGAIEEILDQLPESYSTDLYQRKCEEVYQHVDESYFCDGHSIYYLHYCCLKSSVGVAGGAPLPKN